MKNLITSEIKIAITTQASGIIKATASTLEDDMRALWIDVADYNDNDDNDDMTSIEEEHGTDEELREEIKRSVEKMQKQLDRIVKLIME